jgi:hypothetical protein
MPSAEVQNAECRGPNAKSRDAESQKSGTAGDDAMLLVAALRKIE